MTKNEEVLFRISYNFQELIGNLDEALRQNLDLLVRSLEFDRAAMFLLDEKEESLRPRQIATIYGEVEGEGENFISAKKKSGFSEALKSGRIIHHSRKSDQSVYMPLIHAGRPLGVIRADNAYSRKPIRQDQLENLKIFSRVFTSGIYNAVNHQHQKRQVDKLTTLTRIGTAIATTFKLGEILELALSSLVKDLSYDRAQIYLLDEANKVRENLSIDFRGYFRTMEDVSNVAQLFDSMPLSGGKPVFQAMKLSSNLIANIPINCKGRTSGLLIVDNLFSRQPITPHDLSFLSIMADQLSTVIENSRLFERVEKLSITDSLTGLFNHRYFYERLSEEISRANRFGNTLSLIMLDIDNFKNFNDTYGHQAGDTVLATVSRIIQDNIRAIDVASRYGGEEIAIILPGTEIEGAKIIAERIRLGIRDYELRMNRQAIHVTVSIGLVCYPVDATIKSELVRKADQALYWVKHHGKDGVCAYSRCEDYK